ncbi:MAG: class I SAM-dependent methyltransferase [Fimbriimonadaceae bacterium]|nr:class I SAM-dependent methyltransferase [Fimbriimonadaceae bacterium]
MSREPFDGLAATYDEAFTDTPLAQYFRRRVWDRCAALWPAGSRVLELSCGTGADALYLASRGVQVLATDPAAAMLAVTRRKVATAGAAALVSCRRLRFEEVDGRLGRFDGVLSNFGGLNCVDDLGDVLRRLAGCVRPGGALLLGVMGPLVPWELAWYGWRGEWQRALRRLRPGGVAWRGLRIRYPSIGGLRRAAAPWFELRAATALGALVPPPFAAAWADRQPGLAGRLQRWEDRCGSHWPWPWLADHYLLELGRRGADRRLA